MTTGPTNAAKLFDLLKLKFIFFDVAVINFFYTMMMNF
jgi:hypothetical protein